MKLRSLSLGSPALWLLVPWACALGYALPGGPFGLTEEGAKALLLAWSIGDQVPSSVFTLGAPDVRALLFLPLGFLWSGQVIAAKWMGLLVMAAAAVALYRWRARGDQSEAALLATGTLLVAPLTVAGIDSLAAGPYLLLIGALAESLDRRVGRERGTMGGAFFAQMLLAAAAVSLHPAGLAYPVALTVHWLRESPQRRDRQVALIAIPLSVILVLAMRLGWSGMPLGREPLTAAAGLFGADGAQESLSVAASLGGLALIGLGLAVAIHERRRLWADLCGATLLLGPVFGAACADGSWALLMLALVLYGGIPWLLRACAALAAHGPLVQRGWLWVLLVLVLTGFLRADRSDLASARRPLLSAEDELIRDFADGLNAVLGHAPTTGQAGMILVATPWPARTSLACKCAALPLPPPAKDPETQLAMMRGVSYIILSDSLDSRPLANNFSRLGARIEVLSKQAGGVILRIRPPRDAGT